MKKIITINASDLKMTKKQFNNLNDDDRYKVASKYLKENNIVDVAKFKGIVQVK